MIELIYHYFSFFVRKFEKKNLMITGIEHMIVGYPTGL